ncbi:hypothetical protein [Streptomyces sp. N35]|uniref:DNA polymerase Y family protein n=1 Tax=Streptomyces sp. N35 TaxID=2795730 RepID=UPI0018F484EA|nr:hypothetical protein [Streptomyces sp. N35]
MTTRHILHIHLHGLGPADQAVYEQVLGLLRDITPTVQALPPGSAVLDVTGALRYFDRDIESLAQLVRLRIAAWHSLSATIGAGGSRMIASMAADATAPGGLTAVGTTPEALAGFLRPRPVAALPGIGPATVKSLARYGIHRIGDLADVPLLTLQRILGKAAGRTLLERAQGRDVRTVIPQAPAKSTSASVTFDADELEPVAHHRALLALTERIGVRLRAARQIATGLALSITYADGSTTHRTRTLSEATAHTDQLAATARGLLDSLGLQRARVRGIALRAEGLTDAEHERHQLTLDPADDKRRRIEQAADQARRRFGPAAVVPGALAGYSGTSPQLGR